MTVASKDSHCRNVGDDREIGAYWAERFYEMAAEAGFVCQPTERQGDKASLIYNPTRSKHVAPDCHIFKGSWHQYHEIKHKEPTAYRTFGLEAYRFNDLRWLAKTLGSDVMYTIHNHKLSGGRDAQRNDISHWFTVNVLDLEGKWSTESRGYSYIDGQKKVVPIYYWPMRLWVPLADFWSGIEAPQQIGMELDL